MIIENGVLVKVDNNDINEDGSFTFPKGVTEIGAWAFRNCSSLTKVIIPDEVVSIGRCAFLGCKGLKILNISNEVNQIGGEAFSGCINLERVTIPKSVKHMGSEIFSRCEKLEEVTIEEGVERIPSGTFFNCVNLKKVNIPTSVSKINERAFCGCKGLIEINIPDGVTRIASRTFTGCENLIKINIPKNVTRIDDYAFYECKSLESISIPEKTLICNYAFCDCSNLTEINIPEDVEVTYSAFSGCSSELIIEALKQNETVLNGLGMKEKNNLTLMSMLDEEYAKRNIGSILKFIIENGLEDKYRKLEELEKRVRKRDQEKVANIIWSVKQNININVNSDAEDQIDMQIDRIQKWLDKDFIPTVKLFEKIPSDKVEMFDKKIWFSLAKEPVFNTSEESKIALVELAYTFGVFEKDVVELRGQRRNISDLSAAEKRNGEFEDYQKRVRKILELVQEGKLTKENLHTMFDGTDMKFKPEFYRFFVDNIEEIFSNPEVMESIPKIQRDMEKIVEKYRGQIPTPEECMRYLSEITYTGVKDGNQALAELCKICGITQESFEGYQEIYEEQKKRKESTIPTLKGKGYEILDLDDPKTLLIGEGRFSKCCQKLGGAGEDCMRHSAHSENGRIIEVTDDDGTLIAQSWMWRNGNIVCFDSIEANAIESEKYSDADRKRLIDRIAKTYKDVGKELIEESEEQVEKFRKSKLEEIEKLEGEEKEKALQVLEEVCEESKIKRVTVGKGWWRASQKVSAKFSKNVVSKEIGRVSPRESVGYLNDSNIQYIVAEADDIKELKTDEARVEVKYRDKNEEKSI